MCHDSDKLVFLSNNPAGFQFFFWARLSLTQLTLTQALMNPKIKLNLCDSVVPRKYKIYGREQHDYTKWIKPDVFRLCVEWGKRQIHWFSVSPTQCAADCTTLYFVKMNSSVQPMSFSSSSSSSAVVLAPFLYNLHFSLSPFLSSLSLQDVTGYVFSFL